MPEPESRSPKAEGATRTLGRDGSAFGFRLCFGFRLSGFGFPHPKSPVDSLGGPSPRLRPVRPRCQAFTLVEMIGVLVVIVILAAAVLPSLLKAIDRAVLSREAENLRDMAGALQTLAMTEHRIPGTNTVFADLAAELGWLVSETRTNSRGNERVFLVDPTLRLGPGAGATLPYTQDYRGSTNPANPRVMILSSLGDALPNIVFNPGSYAGTVFNLLWNSADQTKPASWTTSWGGDFDDMVIQRVNFEPLFVQLVLNKSPSTAIPLYAVDEGVRARVTSNPFDVVFSAGDAARAVRHRHQSPDPPGAPGLPGRHQPHAVLPAAGFRVRE
jgi:type II secretory pathway pseudopilin PulG